MSDITEADIRKMRCAECLEKGHVCQATHYVDGKAICVFCLDQVPCGFVKTHPPIAEMICAHPGCSTVTIPENTTGFCSAHVNGHSRKPRNNFKRKALAHTKKTRFAENEMTRRALAHEPTTLPNPVAAPPAELQPTSTHATQETPTMPKKDAREKKPCLVCGAPTASTAELCAKHYFITNCKDFQEALARAKAKLGGGRAKPREAKSKVTPPPRKLSSAPAAFATVKPDDDVEGCVMLTLSTTQIDKLLSTLSLEDKLKALHSVL